MCWLYNNFFSKIRIRRRRWLDKNKFWHSNNVDGFCENGKGNGSTGLWSRRSLANLAQDHHTKRFSRFFILFDRTKEVPPLAEFEICKNSDWAKNDISATQMTIREKIWCSKIYHSKILFTNLGLLQNCFITGSGTFQKGRAQIWHLSG